MNPLETLLDRPPNSTLELEKEVRALALSGNRSAREGLAEAYLSVAVIKKDLQKRYDSALEIVGKSGQGRITDRPRELMEMDTSSGILGVLTDRMPDERTAEAIAWLANLASTGCDSCALTLALVFRDKEHFVDNPNIAFEGAMQAAKAGITESYEVLGDLYREGRGAPQNLQEASRYWELAALDGFVRAQVKIGLAWHRGWVNSEPRDPYKALVWLLIARSNPRFRLVELRTKALGEDQKIAELVELIPQLAAELPRARAQSARDEATAWHLAYLKRSKQKPILKPTVDPKS